MADGPTHKLWGGRFAGGPSAILDAVNRSITVDFRLWPHDIRLSKVVASLPKAHVVLETVVTPWEQKGAVMRSLVEQTKGRDVELVDGIKVNHENGWALCLPDPEEPVTHIWAESGSDGDARRLAQEYARRIRQMVR